VSAQSVQVTNEFVNRTWTKLCVTGRSDYSQISLFSLCRHLNLHGPLRSETHYLHTLTHPSSHMHTSCTRPPQSSEKTILINMPQLILVVYTPAVLPTNVPSPKHQWLPCIAWGCWAAKANNSQISSKRTCLRLYKTGSISYLIKSCQCHSPCANRKVPRVETSAPDVIQRPTSPWWGTAPLKAQQQTTCISKRNPPLHPSFINCIHL